MLVRELKISTFKQVIKNLLIRDKILFYFDWMTEFAQRRDWSTRLIFKRIGMGAIGPDADIGHQVHPRGSS